MACWTQQVWHCGMLTSPLYSTHGSHGMINPVIIREVQSRDVDNKALYDDLRNYWNTIYSWAKA